MLIPGLELNLGLEISNEAIQKITDRVTDKVYERLSNILFGVSIAVGSIGVVLIGTGYIYKYNNTKKLKDN